MASYYYTVNSPPTIAIYKQVAAKLNYYWGAGGEVKRGHTFHILHLNTFEHIRITK